jgi:hypothetical protein
LPGSKFGNWGHRRADSMLTSLRPLSFFKTGMQATKPDVMQNVECERTYMKK